MPREYQNYHLDALDMSVKEVEEKRAKREIANMNERRRMQNINSGFHALRELLPQKHAGEKLSKAAILQHTATYIYQLEQQNANLLLQNSELKRLLGNSDAAAIINSPEWSKRFTTQLPDCPSCKRRKFEEDNKHLDLSPMSGDGSSTESSSEQEPKHRRRGRQNGKSGTGEGRTPRADKERKTHHHNNNNNMLEDDLEYKVQISQNGRHYHATALDASMVADEVEVASESIEIEMHSCPASPPEVLNMADLAANSVYITNQHSTGISSSLEMGHKLITERQHQQQQQQPPQRVQKQNAIALPIDVPFVAPSEVVSDAVDAKTTVMGANNGNGGVVFFVDNSGNLMQILDTSKIQATSSSVPSVLDSSSSSSISTTTSVLHLVPTSDSSKAGSPTILAPVKQEIQVSSSSGGSNGNNNNNHDGSSQNSTDGTPEGGQKTSRQNLNTIVEAIRHLEGDHLFNESAEKLSKESQLKIKKEPDDQSLTSLGSISANGQNVNQL